MAKKKIEKIDISSIKGPEFLKGMDYDSLGLFCEDIRKEIIEKTSIYGGHLSSNLGVVELTVGLFRTFDFTKDKLIFDVGHQSYTEKILTGRKLDHIREKGGPSGFQDRKESPYDVWESGHAGTSLSAAQGFAISRRLKKEDHDIVVVIGDSSASTGMSLEALNSIADSSDKLIIILNDNGMSISKPSGGFFRNISTAKGYNSFKRRYRSSMAKSKFGRGIFRASYGFKDFVKRLLVPTNIFDQMGFTYMGPVNGNDLKAVEKACKRAKNATKTVIMHVITKKGMGYPYAEGDTSGYWHGVTPFEIDSGSPKEMHPETISWSHHFGELTSEFMEDAKNYLICPAMIKGSHLEDAFDKHKDRSIDVGIAEEHALTLAASLSLEGFHPIVSIYSSFLQRAYDQLSHDCARQGADMTILIDRAGLVGKDGATHQGIYDEAYLKSIPNITLAMPSTLKQARALYEESLKEGHGVFAIRYPHSQTKKCDDKGAVLPYGKWLFEDFNESRGTVLIGVGELGRNLHLLLKQEGIEINYIDAVYLFPLDIEGIKRILEMDSIIVYDPYSTEKGFIESLGNELMKQGYKGHFETRCVPNDFISHASIKDQLEDNGLLPEQLVTEIRDLSK